MDFCQILESKLGRIVPKRKGVKDSNKNHSLVYIFKKNTDQSRLNSETSQLDLQVYRQKQVLITLNQFGNSQGCSLRYRKKPYAQSTQSGVQYILV